jgi:ABC-2 type transport system permease protein
VRAAWTIALKDLRLRVRDRSAFIIGVVAPFTLAFVLSLVLGGVTADEFSAEFAVVDLDGGPVATALADVVEGIGGGIDVATDLTEDDARARLEDDELDAAIIIPEGFSEAAQSPEPATLDVVGNIDSQISTQVATAIAEGFTANLNAVRLAVATTGATDPDEASVLANEAAATTSPIAIGEVEAARRQLDGSTYFIAGLSVFLLMFLVQFGVSGLLEERQTGTMARLLAAPIPWAAIPAAKAITSVVLGLAAMTILAVASTLLLDADWGNPLGAGALIVAAVFAAVGIMAVVASVAKTPEQAANIQAVVAVVLGMLGGSFFPIAQSGGLLARLAVLTPHYWFIRGLGDLAGGDGPGAALPAVGALAVFAVVVGGIGLVLMFRKVEP